MRKLTGIVPASDGSFVQITLSEIQATWKVTQIRRREIHSPIGNLLLLNKGIRLGVESRWMHPQVPDTLELHTASTSFGNFFACAQSAHYKIYSDVVENNLCGVFPDDAYLCTIPLHFAESLPDSFVSLAKEEDFYKVALIIDRQMIVVFSLPVVDNGQLHGYLSRIRRYWLGLGTEKKFPETVVLLNTPDVTIDGVNDIRTVSFYREDIHLAKAAGIALCGVEEGVPSFGGQTDACRFKTIRSIGYIFSAFLLAAAIILFATFVFSNIFYEYKINKCKSAYTAIINQNKEIRGLLKTGGILSDKFSRIDSVGSQQSTWAKLLHLIGSQRPSGLFIEKLGSDPMRKSNDVKIALAGWSLNETAVTEMLKKMNSSSLLTNVVLANMERDDKKNNLYTFKILCQLKSGK